MGSFRRDDALYASSITRRPERCQVRHRGTGRHVPARHAEKRSQPSDNTFLGLACEGRGSRMQKILVETRVPKRESPGDPGGGRIHVGERGGAIEKSCTAEYMRIEPIENSELAESVFR